MNLTSLPHDVRVKIMEYMVPHICSTKRDKERLQKHAIQRHIYNKTKNSIYSTYGSLYIYINEQGRWVLIGLIRPTGAGQANRADRGQ